MIEYVYFYNHHVSKNDIPTVKKGKNIYYNLPCSLDIETSSYILKGEKRANMYIWQMCIFGVCVYGRTYQQMLSFFNILKNLYSENGEKIIVYVHNLSYDSHFILKWLNVTNIFATDKHMPLYIEHDDFLIFKCSLRLSNKKLSKLADKTLKIDKKIKGFNYNLIRTPVTPLTDDELLYCETDIKIVYQYILSEIAVNDNDITHIPMTAIGYARRYCRRLCNCESYRNWFMHGCIADEKIYKMLRFAFTGGITHANSIYCDMTLQNITNFDLQSDYPAQIVKNKFPTGAYIHDTLSHFPDDEDIAVLAVVRFEGLRAKYTHSILSYSKCKCKCPYNDTFKISCFYMHKRGLCKFDNIDQCKERLELDNGRIIKCGNVTTVLTEIDFYNLSLMYTWDNYKIIDSYTCKKEYLPRPFVMATLKLYSDKTELKGLAGYETEYKLAKALLNSLYGMCVTDILHDEYLYTPDNDDMWTVNKIENVDEALEKYKTNHSSFLLYQTGVYITAYARRDLVETISNICEMATDTINDKPFDDIVYYDTDSIKILNGEKYKYIFKSFNQINERRLQKAAKFHDFKWDLIAPKDKKGKSRLLGIFDTEQPYKYFKTLGAKRYIYKYDKEPKMYKTLYRYHNTKYHISKKYVDSTFHITIAGINKNSGADYMCEVAYHNNCSPFDIFSDNLYFPYGKSGKKALLYKDNGFTDIITDYLGNECIVTEKSFIYMSDSDYSLGISDEFKQLWQKNLFGGF